MAWESPTGQGLTGYPIPRIVRARDLHIYTFGTLEKFEIKTCPEFYRLDTEPENLNRAVAMTIPKSDNPAWIL